MIKKIVCVGMIMIGLCTQLMADDRGYLGYGGPFTQVTRIDDQDVMQYGVFGGSLYGDFIVGGLAAVGSKFSYGGGYFGYRFDAFDRIAIVPNVTLGYGHYSENETTFGLVDPGVSIEYSLTEYKKIFAGVNYRMTDESDDMDGVSVIMGVEFGHF